MPQHGAHRNVPAELADPHVVETGAEIEGSWKQMCASRSANIKSSAPVGRSVRSFASDILDGKARDKSDVGPSHLVMAAPALAILLIHGPHASSREPAEGRESFELLRARQSILARNQAMPPIPL